MKDFADLYQRLDAATSTRQKRSAILDYVGAARADPARHASAAWVIYFLAGGKPRQIAPTKLLRQLAIEEAKLPEWLFEESYQRVGDLAETLALLSPDGGEEDYAPLDVWMRDRLLPLARLDPQEKFARLRHYARQAPRAQRFVFFKLITGGLRVGVSRAQVIEALSQATGVDTKRIAQRMMSYTKTPAPQASDFRTLIAPAEADSAPANADGRPYPFFLAHALAKDIGELEDALGPVSNWIIEWKYDGIRAQIVHRQHAWGIWSRGEDLVTEAYPELESLREWLPPGVVLDGELVVLNNEKPKDPSDISGLQPFATLQQRLGRKTVTAKMTRALPVAFIAYDLLEQNGRDLRETPFAQRRALLETLVETAWRSAASFGIESPLRLSPRIEASDWASLAALRRDARARFVEGLMLKARDSAYGVGRRKKNDRVDVWWKWKTDPMDIDAVLIYAQRGHGRRSGVYSDYTFAVWSGPPEDRQRMLVPFAKAYSGLSDEEMRAVDSIIRKTTNESFGPVRSVKPTLVFELAFEGIALSKRHKSGVAVRFPRIRRWRQDKPVEDADTLEQLHALLKASADA